MSAGHLGADPEIVAAWVAGWAASRGLGPPARDGEGHFVEVGWQTQRARYVFPTITAAELLQRAEAIDAPWVYLKVCLPAEVLDGAWPAGWVVQPPGTMMTVQLADVSRIASPRAGYRLSLRQDGAALVASLSDAMGRMAASGRLVMSGRHAVFDQIVTDEAHRRRGLGGCVMAALAGEALDRRASQGVLVATAAGRRLYTGLGWQVHAAYSSAVMPGDESDVTPTSLAAQLNQR